jgi:hypothetical protein
MEPLRSVLERYREPGFFARTNGLVVLVAVLAGLFATVFVFRPKAPSKFSAGTGYGVGYGSGSIMLTGGASVPNL